MTPEASTPSTRATSPATEPKSWSSGVSRATSIATRSSADCSSTTWMSWTPTPRSLPDLAQLGADLHEDAAEHVAPAAVAAVAPVAVVGRVLDDLGLAGGEQDGSQVRVLGELRAHRAAHDLVLDVLP